MIHDLSNPHPPRARTANATLTALAHASLLAIIVSLTGCSVNFASDLAKAVQGPELPPPVLVESDDHKDYLALCQKPKPLLRQKDYDGLEELFNQYRQNRESYPASGKWKLACCYETIISVNSKLPDSAFERRLAELQAWREAKPESITAPVAIAAFYVDYAWKARGSDSANAVTPKGWKQMSERLALAKKTLIESGRHGNVCPQWWAEMLRIGLGESWPRKVYDQVYAQAVKSHPAFTSYHASKARWLLPRWYGQDGDWEQFAWSMAASLGGEEGDIAYARIILHQQAYYDDIFNECPLDKEMARRGWLALLKRHPGSLPILSHCARTAAATGDMETSRELFDRLGDKADRQVWKSTAEFEQLRALACAATSGNTPTHDPETVAAREPEDPSHTPENPTD